MEGNIFWFWQNCAIGRDVSALGYYLTVTSREDTNARMTEFGEKQTPHFLHLFLNQSYCDIASWLNLNLLGMLQFKIV